MTGTSTMVPNGLKIPVSAGWAPRSILSLATIQFVISRSFGSTGFCRTVDKVGAQGLFDSIASHHLRFRVRNAFLHWLSSSLAADNLESQRDTA